MDYEVSGPLFFGAADKILKITLDEKMNCLVLRMRSVSAIDATAMHNLEQLYADCKKKNIQIIILMWGSPSSIPLRLLLLWLLSEYVQSSSNQVLSCNGHMINYHMI